MNSVEAEILALLDDTTSNGINAGTPGTRINTFYQGEVVLVPKSYLPGLMVFGTRTAQFAHGTAKDKVEYNITIRVIMDLVSEFTEANASGIIESQYTLRELMEDRSGSGVAAETSVVGILRRNIKGTSFLFHNDYEINYSTIQNNEFFYVAADLNITASTDLVLRS